MARRISVTMLSGYLYCRRKLFLEQVLGLFEPEKEALVKGSIRHAMYDKLNKIEESIVKSFAQGIKFRDMRDKYVHSYAELLRDIIKRNTKKLNNVNLSPLGAFKSLFPRFVKEADSRAFNVYNFMGKYKLYGDELWQKLTPKIKSEFKIRSNNLLLTGIIDQIEEYEDGIVPIELKTGKMPKEGVWPGHKIQLAAYALLLEDLQGNEIKEGFVHYLDADERRQVVINPFLKEEVIELRKKVISTLDSNKIPEICENMRKCAVCGLKKQCFDEKLMAQKLKEKKTLNIT
jgi:CRISPR-associated protein Cas4